MKRPYMNAGTATVRRLHDPTPDPEPIDAEAWFRNQGAADRTSIARFVTAVSSSDSAAIFDSFVQCRAQGTLRRALMKPPSLPPMAAAARRDFREFCRTYGDSLRNDVGDDIVLIRALRALLPAYRGGPVTLFRGEGAKNRKRRAYGMSWTTVRAVAEHHAKGWWRTSRGGSVVLKVAAVAASIIASLKGFDRFAEREYLVDRRFLTNVHVIERYSQALPTESLGG